MTDPCDLPAVDARRLIGTKRLSPVELVESCIGRVDAVDHAVNAIVARDFDRARAAARAAEQAVMRGDPLGKLHGLPFGVKDLEETAGLRTTFGSPLFRDHVPAEDERSVASLRAAGGILLGKTNTPEFGAGANTRNAVYGATGNPFDPTRSCAGSSGGSAVALATGMVPLATGSDLGGSLRNPAAFCGIVGFRPSPGVVPSERHGMGWSPLSVNGPMARNVADLALMLSAMASDDARDPLAPRQVDTYFPLRAVDPSALRVAFTPDFGFAPVERGVRDTFAAVTATLRPLFAASADATPDCTGADTAFAVLRAVGALAAHAEKVRSHPDLVGPNVHANVAEGLRYSAADVAQAELAHTALYRRWQQFFKQVDLIITPAITITPRPWRELFPAEIDGVPTRSYYHWLALAYAVTLAGHPAVCIPAGLDAAGMPFGLQIVGPRGGDAFVLAAAAALQAVLPQRPVPELAQLRAAQPIRLMEGFLGFG
ncbi:MAG: amidase family protein [Rhodospirillales bacterium]|nr:amidase family protein [Rhodospirillales bacterium]